MFRGLLIVRLRAAEKALRDGRLDEAYRLATAPDIREHRQGARLLRAVSERLIERARVHFDADRFTEALLDLDKAEACGVEQARIAELRDQIRTVADEELRKERSRRDRLEAARQRVENGSLEAGRRILEDAPSQDAEAQELQRRAERRQRHAEQMFGEVERFVEQGQLAAAIERFRRARRLQPQSPAAVALESRICTRVLDRAMQALEEGKPGRAADEVGSLGELGARLPVRREIEEALRLIRAASEALSTARVDDVRQAVLRLRNLLPKAKWVARTVDDLKEIGDKLMALRAGPLGESPGDVIPAVAGAAKPASPDLAETVAVGTSSPAPGSLPECLLVLIDGGGSYLLHRGERVSIGRAASSHPADIPIFSDLAEQHADVARVEDDYFIFCPRDAQVNGEGTKQKLLQDGDRVALGHKARFTFRLPSRRSASAILEMSDSSKLPDDVRRVVLFRGNATIGSGPAAHMPCPAAGRPLLLFERGGRLWVRPQERGGGSSQGRPVGIGKSVEIDGVRFVIQPWQVRASGPGRMQYPQAGR